RASALPRAKAFQRPVGATLVANALGAQARSHGRGPSSGLWERPWSRTPLARKRAPTGEGSSAGPAALFCGPARIGARGEREVVVARGVGHFAPGPRRQGEMLVGAGQLDLGDHQAGVVAEEL